MSSEFALSPPRKRPMELLRLVGWAVALAFLVWAWRGAEMRPMTLITESGNILTLIKDFFPPDFTDWRLYATEMVVTLQVAIWGTLLAVVCAVPLGILSSDNIVPWWVYHPVRRLMDAARAINEMVFAMLFVVAVGLGPFAGVLALWVHTTGVLAKLFSEAVEAIEPSPGGRDCLFGRQNKGRFSAPARAAGRHHCRWQRGNAEFPVSYTASYRVSEGKPAGDLYNLQRQLGQY